MWTKRFTLIAVILTLVVVLFSQERAATNPSPSGYQLVSVPITTGPFGDSHTLSEAHRVFLLDTASGKTWEYVSEFTGRDGAFHTSFLSPVEMKR